MSFGLQLKTDQIFLVKKLIEKSYLNSSKAFQMPTVKIYVN